MLGMIGKHCVVANSAYFVDPGQRLRQRSWAEMGVFSDSQFPLTEIGAKATKKGLRFLVNP